MIIHKINQPILMGESDGRQVSPANVTDGEILNLLFSKLHTKNVLFTSIITWIGCNAYQDRK